MQTLQVALSTIVEVEKSHGEDSLGWDTDRSRELADRNVKGYSVLHLQQLKYESSSMVFWTQVPSL